MFVTEAISLVQPFFCSLCFFCHNNTALHRCALRQRSAQVGTCGRVAFMLWGRFGQLASVSNRGDRAAKVKIVKVMGHETRQRSYMQT